MLTEDQINFLNRVCPDKWAEENGVINVGRNLNIADTNLTEITIRFGNVNGHFDCSFNKLTTVKNAPSIINGFFNCDSNKLTTLEGGPKQVRGYYSCEYNQLTSLIGAPKMCNANFTCVSNQLTSLEGCPYKIKDDLWCVNNPKLYILYGIGRVEGKVHYDNCNDLNEWIISMAHLNTFVSSTDIAKWIKDNNKLEFLLGAPKEIRKYFSPRILYLVDMDSYLRV